MTVRVSGGERFAFFTNASGREIETVLFLRGADNPAAFDLETGRTEALVPAGAGYRLTVPAKGSALIFSGRMRCRRSEAGRKRKSISSASAIRAITSRSTVRRIPRTA